MDLQVKTALRFHFTAVRMAKIDNTWQFMLVRMWNKWNTPPPLVVVQTCVTITEINKMLSQKIGNRSTSRPIYTSCLRVLLVWKDHSNPYKGKHLIGNWLTMKRFSPLSSCWEAWWSAGRHGAGEGLRVLQMNPSGRRKEEWATRPMLNF